MSPSTAVAGVHDATVSTRENYERFAFQLIRLGQVPGAPLSHLDFRVLLFLLAQKPGAYAAHHRTIAAALDSNTTSVRAALRRLRDAGLVLWELIAPHHRLPSGQYARTNVNRYWVNLPRLAGALAPRSESKSSPPALPATRSESDAPTRLVSDASSGTDQRSEQRPPPYPPRTAPPPDGAALGGREAVSKEITPIVQAWNALSLGEVGSREARALENRRAEGATLEQLEAAVAGAGADGWLRRHAHVPFAVVFASLASLERFAHEGRKLLPAPPPLEIEPQQVEAVPGSPPPQLSTYRDRIDNVSPPNCQPLPGLRVPCAAPLSAAPLSAEEFAQRRVAEIARAEAWVREQERLTSAEVARP